MINGMLGRCIAVTGAALLAGGNVAFAQSSGVQLYGVVTAGISQKTNQTGGTTQFGNYLLNSSYLGLRGSEDLGGGLRATFQLETGVETGTGEAGSGSKFWNRHATAGLANGQFALTLGRQFHASTDRVTRSLDAFNVSGASLHVTPLALFGVNKFMNNDNRSDNTIKLRWNGPAGVTAALSTAPDHDSGRSMGFDLAQVTRNYVVALYGVRFKSPNPVAATGQRPEHRVLGAGGQYRVGQAVLYLNVARSSLEASAAGRPKQTNTLLIPGIRYNMLPFVLKASYTLDSGKNINNVAGRDGKKKTLIAAIEYHLSKRTAVAFAVFRNSFTDGYKLDPVNIAALARDPESSSTSGYAMGLRHNF
ncbi:porin [Verticiella sediminum]|nr:porin [Verticiella sediminum]